MLKKTVLIVIISVLVISIGAVSVFADPNIGNVSSTNIPISIFVNSTEYELGYINISVQPLYGILVDSNSVSNTSGSTIVNSTQYTFDMPYQVTIKMYTQTNSSVTGFTYNYFLRLYEDYFRFTFNSSYPLPSNYTHFVSTNGRGSYFDNFSDNLGSVTSSGTNDFYVYPIDLGGGYIQNGFAQEKIYSFTYHEFITYSTMGSPSVDTLIEPLFNPCGIISDLTFKSSHLQNGNYVITNSKIIQNNKYNIRSSYDDSYNTMTIAQKSSEINDNVQSILDAYTSNSAAAGELKSDVQTNDQKLDNIHQSEAEWYSQNSQAIESTGLSNFEFSSDQSSALTGVFSLFQRLWTALGDYTFVVTFTLMMSFATFFLRHNPVKKTSGNNYSRNYSKGGGESHGSSAR